MQQAVWFGGHPLFRRSLPLGLAFLLAFSPAVYGQQPTPPPAQPRPPAQIQPMAPLPVVQNLRVLALAGDGEMNDLERHIMAPLVIQVLDQNGRPVEGAEVIFRFPPQGPGAAFANQKTSQTTRTNVQGQAAATGWVANGEVGSFQVHATATYGNQMGEKTISMSNVTRVVEEVKKRDDKKWWATRKFKIAVIAGGAAAVVGIILATRGGGSQSTPITITPGNPSVGGPQ